MRRDAHYRVTSLTCTATTAKILARTLTRLARRLQLVLPKMTEKPVPEGFSLHTENTSHLLLSGKEAFLNPVQEFNRDISVACITAWSEDNNATKETKWRRSQEKKAQGKANKRRKGTFNE